LRYRSLSDEFNSHDTFNHSRNEYVRDFAHTNTVERYFSILKRSIMGTRTSLGVNDAERAVMFLKSIEGKRLTYS
jgi:hypothetical protein